ncbi:unnamed protein product [Pleuronectes platessa]|uniref:Uncharacterized protein n=1 Tax=Pleuronectes platessa TaxID=8262 RepID=A0A9N7Y508_PLEPL|nr:unnamed protein product [Pleuronectes platessa]
MVTVVLGFVVVFGPQSRHGGAGSEKKAGTGMSGRVQAGWRINGEARMTAERRGTRRFCVEQGTSHAPSAHSTCQGKQRRGGGETKTTTNNYINPHSIKPMDLCGSQHPTSHEAMMRSLCAPAAVATNKSSLVTLRGGGETVENL